MENNLKLTIIYTPCEEGGYTANIKEIRGVISEGDTLEEAKVNVLDALELMLEVERDEFENNYDLDNTLSDDLMIIA